MKETVFVSGATGFLGTEVVSRLLTETDADIYVLVRAEDEEAARARLRNAWHHEENLYRQIDAPSSDQTSKPTGDPTSAPTGRVHPAAGDFTMPGLGLSEEMQQLLAEQVTLVFHCGAEIGFQQDEKTLKETNCKGTENMVAFAKAMPQLKRFVHVSTAYVAGQKTGVITEEELPATHFSSLYEKSKAEAEYIVMTAGLPYAICRPGMIVGDSRTGRVKNFNTIYYVLKMILLGKLRVIPTRGDTRLNLVPVDHVADAVVKIGLAESAEGKTYHLTCPTHLQPRADELLQYVRKWAKENLETDIPKPAFVPLHGLKKAGLAYNKRQEDRKKNYLSNLLTLLPYFYGGQDFSRKNTDAVAGPYDLNWRDYIDRILEFACRKNFMQQTDRTVFQQAQVRRKSGRYPITYYDVSAEGITLVSGEEANKRIEQAAGALWADGVRPGERVALSGINSVAYMILEQAIGLIGAVSVPIYYTTPAEELSLLLQRSGARWLFVGDTRIAQQLGDIPQTVRTISFSVADPLPQPGVVSWDAFLAKGKEPAPAVHPSPDDLATIRYTSGTTGKPKGVMFTFAQLAWMGEVLTGLLPWEERNRSMRYLSFLPLSHVVEGILAAYAPYYMLAKSDIYYLNDFGALTDALPKVRPSVFFSVPRFYEKVWEKTAESSAYKKWSGMKDGRAKALMTAVLRRGVLKRAGLDACSQLIVGSAPVSEALLRNFRDIGIEIHNAYGQTEAPLITINRLGDNVIPTIGTPLPDTEVTVTDAGELLVKGPQVMTGYYGMETDCLEDGILRTGDLGTIHANGHITLTGRKKEMIVTAYGKNISIPKIEERLKNIQGVTEAVLIGENRPYCTALLWVQGGENREEEATRIVAQIKAMNEELSHPEQVKKFKVIERPLSIQSGELTPNLKVKRRNIEEHFKEIIEEMYS